MAMSQEHGSTLQAVQQLMKKNQVRPSEQPAIQTEAFPSYTTEFNSRCWYTFTTKQRQKHTKKRWNEIDRYDVETPSPNLCLHFVKDLQVHLDFTFNALCLYCRHFRGSCRATGAGSTTSWKGRGLSHPYAALRPTASGRVTTSWPSCGVCSGLRLRGGSSSWMLCTRPSSTTLTRPRWRPGWASRSCTWWTRRRGRFVCSCSAFL